MAENSTDKMRKRMLDDVKGSLTTVRRRDFATRGRAKPDGA